MTLSELLEEVCHESSEIRVWLLTADADVAPQVVRVALCHWVQGLDHQADIIRIALFDRDVPF